MVGVASSEASAGLRDAAAGTFAEAVGLAHDNGRMLREIAGAQWRAGFVREAAATFEQAVTTMQGPGTVLIVQRTSDRERARKIVRRGIRRLRPHLCDACIKCDAL